METTDNNKYEAAKKQVEEIKGFYTHLTVYILVNLFLLLAQLGIFRGNFNPEGPIWTYFTTPFFWGIGLLFHGLYVFKHKLSFLKSWEERKIKEYMEKEEKEFNEKFK